jgi:hypothetical protein
LGEASLIETLCIGLAVVTAGFALVHLLLALWFRGWLRRQQGRADSGHSVVDANGPVAVLVAARGLDESVAHALKSLGRQDFPGFSVIVAADGWPKRDRGWLPGFRRLADTQGEVSGSGFPAREKAAETSETWVVEGDQGNLQLQVVEGWERLPTCGLKCSALRAAARRLPENCRWVAFMDVDVVPGKDWLATLVAAGRGPEGIGGAASGLQWFEPVAGSAGSWVRSLWNAAALFPTALFANSWAGSMVIRKDWLETSGLVEDWARNIVDDGPVRAALARIRKQHRLAARVVMTNVEGCSLAGAANWLGRMVKWSSIYERNFVGTLLHGITTSILILGGIGLLAWGLLTGVGAAWWIPLGWAVGNAFYLAGWLVMREAARSSETVSAHQPAKRTGFSQLMLGWCLVTVTQVLFCGATFRALFARRYRWRGVEYDVARDGRVKVIGDDVS